MRFSLRKALLSDRARIHRLVRAARLNPFGVNWRRFIVAVDDKGRILGCVQVKPHRGGWRELASLVVDEAWRRRGVGSALVSVVLESASPPLWLMCRSDLAPYYARFGFEEITDRSVAPGFLGLLLRIAQPLMRKRRSRLAVMRWRG